jgi:hypothetical protein
MEVSEEYLVYLLEEGKCLNRLFIRNWNEHITGVSVAYLSAVIFLI